MAKVTETFAGLTLALGVTFAGTAAKSDGLYEAPKASQPINVQTGTIGASSEFIYINHDGQGYAAVTIEGAAAFGNWMTTATVTQALQGHPFAISDVNVDRAEVLYNAGQGFIYSFGLSPIQDGLFNVHENRGLIGLTFKFDDANGGQWFLSAGEERLRVETFYGKVFKTDSYLDCPCGRWVPVDIQNYTFKASEPGKDKHTVSYEQWKSEHRYTYDLVFGSKDREDYVAAAAAGYKGTLGHFFDVSINGSYAAGNNWTAVATISHTVDLAKDLKFTFGAEAAIAQDDLRKYKDVALTAALTKEIKFEWGAAELFATGDVGRSFGSLGCGCDPRDNTDWRATGGVRVKFGTYQPIETMKP